MKAESTVRRRAFAASFIVIGAAMTVPFVQSEFFRIWEVTWAHRDTVLRGLGFIIGVMLFTVGTGLWRDDD